MSHTSRETGGAAQESFVSLPYNQPSSPQSLGVWLTLLKRYACTHPLQHLQATAHFAP